MQLYDLTVVNKIFHLHDEKPTLYLIKNDAQQLISQRSIIDAN
ncbi:hypothetical protein XBO1_1300151 [Xenorhabdus bovienii str. oregonense]|uniref:Uncharacterized protein n=1 Tax=Xenorhabdus bovienii str. oregonense TaxID=1398202 RepID=A0A077NR42_XENBV|nr:hypothetical protein XBO1_1300151 [Xenorhabdus bovienii str. oregonense]